MLSGTSVVSSPPHACSPARMHTPHACAPGMRPRHAPRHAPPRARTRAAGTLPTSWSSAWRRMTRSGRADGAACAWMGPHVRGWGRMRAHAGPMPCMQRWRSDACNAQRPHTLLYHLAHDCEQRGSGRRANLPLPLLPVTRPPPAFKFKLHTPNGPNRRSSSPTSPYGCWSGFGPPARAATCGSSCAATCGGSPRA